MRNCRAVTWNVAETVSFISTATGVCFSSLSLLISVVRGRESNAVTTSAHPHTAIRVRVTLMASGLIAESFPFPLNTRKAFVGGGGDDTCKEFSICFECASADVFFSLTGFLQQDPFLSNGPLLQAGGRRRALALHHFCFLLFRQSHGHPHRHRKLPGVWSGDRFVCATL